MKTLWKSLALDERAMILRKIMLEYSRDFYTTKALIICFSGLFFHKEFSCIKCLQLMLNSYFTSSI